MDTQKSIHWLYSNDGVAADTSSVQICDSQGCFTPRDEIDALGWCVLLLALCVATLGGVAVADRRRR